MNCPHCGAIDVVNLGVCSACGQRSKGGCRIEPRCRTHRWGPPRPTMTAGEVREKCVNCGEERQHEEGR